MTPLANYLFRYTSETHQPSKIKHGLGFGAQRQDNNKQIKSQKNSKSINTMHQQIKQDICSVCVFGLLVVGSYDFVRVGND